MANFQNYPQQGGQNNYGGAVNNAPMAGGTFQPQPAYGQAPVQQAQQPAQQAYQQPAYGGQPAQQAYPQAPVVQQQPVQQQAPVQPSQIGGTRVLKIHVNPNWKYGDKGWIAVVTVATDESLYLSNINVRNGQRGMFFSWPGHPRMQNGQPVMSQKGKQIYSNFYNPYRSKKQNYHGEAIMNCLCHWFSRRYHLLTEKHLRTLRTHTVIPASSEAQIKAELLRMVVSIHKKDR